MSRFKMGHSDIKVTLDVYSHLLKDTNPAAAARTDKLIFNDTSKPTAQSK